MWIDDELSPRNLVSSLNAALVLFLLELITTLSLTALVFSGQLAVRVPEVFGSMLLGNALLIVIVAVLSSYGGSLAAVQDAPAVILAVAVSTLAANAGSSQQAFASVVVLIAGSSLVLGLVYLLVGAFKLGSLVRFIPYPVVGGFLAGTGWLLATGGIGVAVELPLGMALLQPGALARWMPALLLGIAISLAVRRWSSPLTLAVIFVLAGFAFWGVMLLRGISFATISAEGWLIGPFPLEIGLRVPPTFSSLGQANWPALLSVLPLAAPSLLIGLIGILLNASSLELIVKRDMDLNRELLGAGVANMLSSIFGGLIGFHSISASTLNHATGKGKRLPGLLVALLLVLVAVLGTALLSYIPRVLLAALLIYTGLELLYEYVISAWSSFSKPDYAVIVSILIIVAIYGFLWGVGLGLVLAVLLFVISYSRISSIRYELTGATVRSRVSRGLRQIELLDAAGEQLLIYRLQGFIFFGTANNLFERVRARVLRAGVPVRFVVLDFANVSGLDATARLSFRKLLQTTHERGIELVFSGLEARARQQLLQGGFGEASTGLRVEADLDRAVEHCENSLIADADHTPQSLEAQLPQSVLGRAEIAALIRSMQRRELAAGEVIIQQGAPPDELFFVESGRLTAQLEQAGRAPLRLETMQGGRMVGEVGFLLGTPRSASVVAEQPSVVYVLSRAEWTALNRERPELAQALSSLVLQLLGQRVAHLTRVVDALQ